MNWPVACNACSSNARSGLSSFFPLQCSHHQPAPNTPSMLSLPAPALRSTHRADMVLVHAPAAGVGVEQHLQCAQGHHCAALSGR